MRSRNKNAPFYARPRACSNASAALISSAFQQQFIRDLHLGLPGPIRVKNVIGAVESQENIAESYFADTQVTWAVSKEAREPMLLADRMGLVNSFTDVNEVNRRDIATRPIDDPFWVNAKKIAECRGDWEKVCSICYDDFRTQKQVLLSCSHTFHLNCILSFERFSDIKKCPLCRSSYVWKEIDDAKQAYFHLCAKRIQSVWKGQKARKCFLQRLKFIPPNSYPGLYRKHILKSVCNFLNDFSSRWIF